MTPRPRHEQPSRQREYRQLVERVQTLEDIIHHLMDRLNALRIRVKALEVKAVGNGK